MNKVIRSPCINWNNYKSVFDIFRDTEVKIISIKETGAYTKQKEVTELCSVLANIIPYNGGLLASEYGLTAECEYKMFCDTDEHLTEGNYAETGGQRYRIIYAEPWNMGAVAILQRVTI